MTKSRICYVDEESRDINLLYGALEGDFEVLPILVTPEYTCKKLVDELLTMEFEMLVVDYNLKQKTSNRFMGDELLKEFNSVVGHFPQLLLTNHDQDAIRKVNGIDVNDIMGKYEYSDHRESFIERLRKQIELHRRRVNDSQSTLERLSKKVAEHRPLTFREEEAYLEADLFLDTRLLPSDRMIPHAFKKMTLSNDDKLSELIKTTEELLSELKND